VGLQGLGEESHHLSERLDRNGITIWRECRVRGEDERLGVEGGVVMNEGEGHGGGKAGADGRVV